MIIDGELVICVDGSLAAIVVLISVDAVVVAIDPVCMSS